MATTRDAFAIGAITGADDVFFTLSIPKLFNDIRSLGSISPH